MSLEMKYNSWPNLIKVCIMVVLTLLLYWLLTTLPEVIFKFFEEPMVDISGSVVNKKLYKDKFITIRYGDPGATGAAYISIYHKHNLIYREITGMQDPQVTVSYTDSIRILLTERREDPWFTAKEATQSIVLPKYDSSQSP